MSFVLMYGLINLTVAQNRTDCKDVMRSLYPNSPQCQRDDMTCGSDFACYVEENECEEYDCKAKGRCPVGTRYQTFVPSAFAPSSSDEHTSTSEAGYMCCPDEICPEPTFECFFDPDNDHMLTVNVTVPDIFKQTEHYWDTREITLINRERYDNRTLSQKYVDVFNSMAAIDDGECVGQKDDNGYVVFRNIVSSEACQFSVTHEVDSQGILWYTRSFVVGYDDLIDIDLNGNVVIDRYGRSDIMNCRIRASDTLYVYPGAEGEHDESETDANLKIEFSLEMFTEPDFKSENIFPDGGMIDISGNSQESQLIYVQAKAEITSGDSADYMIHIKSCQIESNKTIDGVDKQDNPQTFLIDGCRAADPPGSSYLSRRFALKDSRVQWSDENNDKTVVVDQFSALLWDPNTDKDVDSQSYRFKCDLVVCQIGAFQRNSDDLHYNSICVKNEECSTRYDNLFNNGRYNRNSEMLRNQKYGVSDVIQAQGAVTVNGAPYSGLAICLILFISLL